MFIYLVKFVPPGPLFAIAAGRDAAQAGHCARMSFFPHPAIEEITCIGQRTEAHVATDPADPFVIAQAYE